MSPLFNRKCVAHPLATHLYTNGKHDKFIITSLATESIKQSQSLPPHWKQDDSHSWYLNRRMLAIPILNLSTLSMKA